MQIILIFFTKLDFFVKDVENSNDYNVHNNFHVDSRFQILYLRKVYKHFIYDIQSTKHANCYSYIVYIVPHN